MADKIQLRRDSAADFTSVNPVLADGEQGHESDTNKRKIGDGVTAWNSLPYIFESFAETDTTLTKLGNTLRYIGEDGLNQDVDLSIYIDDTNLSRLVSGTINAAGIVTFSRDDASSFTIDFSSLFDDTNLSRIVSGAVVGNDLILTRNDTSTIVIDFSSFSPDLSAYYTKIELDGGQLDTRYYTKTEINSQELIQDAVIALNTAKVSADGSVDTHSDVDLSGIATGDQLEWDGIKLVPKAILNGFTVFPVWAEESGGLTNGSQQWSFGNGAVGEIGVPLGLDCELFAVSLQADNFGTSVSIDFERDNVAINTTVFNTNSTSINITAVPFLFGERISFRTNTEVGAASDVRVCAWFRVKATAAFPTTDINTASIAGLAFNSATFSDVPSLSTTVNLSSIGKVEGNYNYSALRSGAANAVTQFRIVIGADNGQSFFDTLSTFNDTGSCSHFVENQPAGAYTVKVQALTDNPIIITSASVRASAVEN